MRFHVLLRMDFVASRRRDIRRPFDQAVCSGSPRQARTPLADDAALPPDEGQDAQSLQRSRQPCSRPRPPVMACRLLPKVRATEQFARARELPGGAGHPRETGIAGGFAAAPAEKLLAAPFGDLTAA